MKNNSLLLFWTNLVATSFFSRLAPTLFILTLSGCSAMEENTGSSQIQTQIDIQPLTMAYKDTIRADSTGKEVLINWLEEHKNSKLVIPVLISFDEFKLKIAEANIYQGSQSKIESPLSLQLQDSPMGISLLDNLLQICPKDQGDMCLVYLEGTWGPLSSPIQALHDSSTSESVTAPKTWPFVVFKVRKDFSEQNSKHDIIYQLAD